MHSTVTLSFLQHWLGLTLTLTQERFKLELRQQHPELYEEFEVVRTVRNNDMVSSLPRYVYFLGMLPQARLPTSSAQNPCPNPPFLWYPNGPYITTQHFPVPDLDCALGGKCDHCKGQCVGHYKINCADVTDEQSLKSISYPSSAILKTALSNALSVGRKELTDSEVDTMTVMSDCTCALLLKCSTTVLCVNVFASLFNVLLLA